MVITLLDYLILPFVLLIVYSIAYNYRNKHYPPNHPYRKYFLPALTLKIFGAIFIGLVYQYYYKGGDTLNYFIEAQTINSAFADSPTKWINLVLHIPNTTTYGYYNYISRFIWYQEPATYTVASITAVISKLTGGTYLPTAAIFATLSFTGIWALFRTFATIYPSLIKPIAIATLYIPSVVVWGSGIFKDTICLFGLGWLTYSVFKVLIDKNFKVSNLILILLSFLLVAEIKVYILMAFLPALFVWILFSYSQNIQNSGTRIFVKTFAMLFVLGISAYAMASFGEQELGRYSISNIENTATITRNWIIYSSGDQGSSYNLGEINGINDMLLKFPAAVNVTLFRPYLWEARKIFVLVSAIESMLFLFLTLKVFFLLGIKKIWQTISQDPNIQFCLIFALIFAFAVGITSGNFGALSRYKIPCLPFFGLSILLIYYTNNPKKPLLKFLGI